MPGSSKENLLRSYCTQKSFLVVECLVLNFLMLWSPVVKRLLRPGPVMQKTAESRISLLPVRRSLFHQHQKQGVFPHFLEMGLM